MTWWVLKISNILAWTGVSMAVHFCRRFFRLCTPGGPWRSTFADDISVFVRLDRKYCSKRYFRLRTLDWMKVHVCNGAHIKASINHVRFAIVAELCVCAYLITDYSLTFHVLFWNIWNIILCAGVCITHSHSQDIEGFSQKHMWTYLD